jgi:hypothetical protein
MVAAFLDIITGAWRAAASGTRRWPLSLVCGGILHGLLVVAIFAQCAYPETRPAWPSRIFHDARYTAGPGADFFAMYHAGVNLRHGLSPYDSSEPVRVTPYFYPYRYLPLTAHVLGRPLTVLPPYSALLAWMLVIEATLVWWLILLGSRCRPLVLQLVLLLSTPYLLELYLGQFTFVAAVLAAAGIIAWHAGRRFGAVASIALGAHLKVYPAIALASLPSGLRNVNWAVLGLGLVLVPNLWWSMQPEVVSGFVVKNLVGDPAGLDAGNHSLLYAAYLMWPAGWSLADWGRLALAWRVVVLTVTVVLVLLSRARADVKAGALLLAHFVSYFQLWEHHLAAAILCGTLVLSAPIIAVGSRRVGIVALVALALPSPWLAIAGAPGGVWHLLPPLAKSLPLFVLYLVSVKAVLHGRSGASGAAEAI